MAQGLQLAQRLSQSLVLSPQMQQSLALLQAPTLELKALVEQEMQQNPVLEEAPTPEADQAEKSKAEDGESMDSADHSDPAEPPADVTFENDGKRPLSRRMISWRSLKSWPRWTRSGGTILRRRTFRCGKTAEDEEKRQFMFDSIVAVTSLQETLIEQVRDSRLTAEQRPIAEMIIGNIDDHGYLKTSLEELSTTTNTPIPKIEEVLKVVQTFDPSGVGARDLQECLMRQLERSGEGDSIEYRIVRDFMEALGKRRIPEIARGLSLEVEDVQDAIRRIARLEPRPGRAYVTDSNQYILPEVFVHRVGDDFVVTTNNEQIPHLRISNTYKDLMAQSGNTAEVINYIREKIRAPGNSSSRASISGSRRF